MWRPPAAMRHPLALGRGRLLGGGPREFTRNCSSAKDAHLWGEKPPLPGAELQVSWIVVVRMGVRAVWGRPWLVSLGLGGGLGAGAGLGRLPGQGGATAAVCSPSADCSPVSLTGMDDIPGQQPPPPPGRHRALRGEAASGLGGRAWRGRGWVSAWLWGCRPLPAMPGDQGRGGWVGGKPWEQRGRLGVGGCGLNSGSARGSGDASQR